MSKITVSINDALERTVRTEISRSGGKKGDLSKTVEAALRLWLSKNIENKQNLTV